ncbi:MAG: type VI secretion system baseplate subunit TssG [Aquabacterium sp.]
MPPAQRRHAIGVIDQLLEEPQRFEFFQAVRLLERWLEAEPASSAAAVGAAEPGLSRLNFRNSLSLSFPVSEIEALQVHRQPVEGYGDGTGGEEGAEHTERTERTEREGASRVVNRIDITPAFMGLLGVNGTLPLFYTEMLAQRELYQKDQGARSFMDVFSHRAVMLFYQAWRKHRLHLQYEASPRQHFLGQVLAIAGLGHKGMRDRLRARGQGVSDEALAYFAGGLQKRAVSAGQLQLTLQHYLNVPVKVEQFVGRWYALPEAGRFHLGQRSGALGGTVGRTAGGMLNGVLGRSAMLGERVWQRDLRLRLVLGPLDHRRFRRFLPHGAGATALKEWLTLMSGVSLEYEVQLCLQREDVQGLALDSSRMGNVGRLGWDTFLQTQPANEDRLDVAYDIHAAA